MLVIQASVQEASGALVQFSFDLLSPRQPRLAERPLPEQSVLSRKVLVKLLQAPSVLN